MTSLLVLPSFYPLLVKKKKYRECFHFLLLQIFCISFFVSNIFLCSGVLFDFWLRRFRSSASSFSFFFLSQLGPGMNEWERRAQKKKEKRKEENASFVPASHPSDEWPVNQVGRRVKSGSFPYFLLFSSSVHLFFSLFFLFFMFDRRAIVKLPTLTEFFTCLIRRLLPERSTWLFFSWMLLYWNGRWFMAPTWVRREWPINDLLKQAWAGFLIHLNRTS